MTNPTRQAYQRIASDLYAAQRLIKAALVDIEWDNVPYGFADETDKALYRLERAIETLAQYTNATPDAE